MLWLDLPRRAGPFKTTKHSADKCVSHNVYPGQDEDMIKGQSIVLNAETESFNSFLR